MPNVSPRDLASRARLLEIRSQGRLDLAGISPDQASAFWHFELLNAAQIVELANNWLLSNLDRGSIELASIALNDPGSLSEVRPMFNKALEEMNVVSPSQDRAILIVLAVFLAQISKRKLPPMSGMRLLDNFYTDHIESQDLIVIRHPKYDPSGKQEYLGSKLGIEHLYTWYREFQDAADGHTWYFNELPLDAQLDKFDDHLMQEAEALLDHLNRVWPELNID